MCEESSNGELLLHKMPLLLSVVVVVVFSQSNGIANLQLSKKKNVNRRSHYTKFVFRLLALSITTLHVVFFRF